jgi:hypothetical protein
MARLVGAILSLALASTSLEACYASPLHSAATDNPEVHAELLFTHDGCRIYRFRDAWARVYYADCRGPSGSESVSSSTSWNESCGRNCTRPVLVTTTTHAP